MNNYFNPSKMAQLLDRHLSQADKMADVGLYGGKLGLIILLYHYYACFNRNKSYKILADRLMESVIIIPADISYRFSDGLCGIGWALLYLIKNNFVEVEEEILVELDRQLMDFDWSQIKKEADIEELIGLISYVEARQNHISEHNSLSSLSPAFLSKIKSLKQKGNYKTIDAQTVFQNIAEGLQKERRVKLTKSNVMFDSMQITVRHNGGFIKIKYREVLLLKWEEGYTVIRLLSGKEILETRSLKEMTTFLPKCFYRINKKYILNLCYTNSCLQKKGNIIVLMEASNEKFIISRRRISGFKKQMERVAKKI